MPLDKGQERRGRVTKGEDGNSPWLDLRTISWVMGGDSEKGEEGGNEPELCEIGVILSHAVRLSF